MWVSLPSNSFLLKRSELFKKLGKGVPLNRGLEGAVIDTYGPRGIKALSAIKGRRVIRRGDRWFVRGRGDEYEIVQTFCSCRDYVLNVVTGKADVDMCYHALAKRICELLDAYYGVERPSR